MTTALGKATNQSVTFVVDGHIISYFKFALVYYWQLIFFLYESTIGTFLDIVSNGHKIMFLIVCYVFYVDVYEYQSMWSYILIYTFIYFFYIKQIIRPNRVISLSSTKLKALEIIRKFDRKLITPQAGLQSPNFSAAIEGVLPRASRREKAQIVGRLEEFLALLLALKEVQSTTQLFAILHPYFVKYSGKTAVEHAEHLISTMFIEPQGPGREDVINFEEGCR